MLPESNNSVAGMKDFNGKIAVVTGGGTGMGRELVCQLIGEGAHVAMCDIFEDTMAETAAAAAPAPAEEAPAIADAAAADVDASSPEGENSEWTPRAKTRSSPGSEGKPRARERALVALSPPRSSSQPTPLSTAAPPSSPTRATRCTSRTRSTRAS